MDHLLAAHTARFQCAAELSEHVFMPASADAERDLLRGSRFRRRRPDAARLPPARLAKPQVLRGHDGAGRGRLKMRHRPGWPAGTSRRAGLLTGCAVNSPAAVSIARTIQFVRDD